MNKPLITGLAGAIALALATSTAIAKVSPEEAARLGKDLTPMGAERAGNAEGTIPEWAPLDKVPDNVRFQIGDRHPDPFDADKPKFTINGANYKEYADKLSPGQIAMMQKFPDSFFMNVYETRRTAAQPQKVYDGTLANATRTELTAEKEGFTKACCGTPFPIPADGHEVMFNHRMHYWGDGVSRWNNQAIVTKGGDYTLVRMQEEMSLPYFYQSPEELDEKNMMWLFLQVIHGPARLAGKAVLLHESIDQIRTPRQAWSYNPGQRRVRRAPNVAYDNPGSGSDGLRTNDQSFLFNGAMDRYSWESKGKREMYIPYNSYKLHSGSTADEVIQPGHIDQNLARYELHRVWQVNSTIKPGSRHIYKRRDFYLDEDSWSAVLVDYYDNRDQLWRFSEAHQVVYYDVPLINSTLDTHYDLLLGRYLVAGLDNDEASPDDFYFKKPDAYYTPAGLRKLGKR